MTMLKVTSLPHLDTQRHLALLAAAFYILPSSCLQLLLSPTQTLTKCRHVVPVHLDTAAPTNTAQANFKLLSGHFL